MDPVERWWDITDYGELLQGCIGEGLGDIRPRWWNIERWSDESTGDDGYHNDVAVDVLTKAVGGLWRGIERRGYVAARVGICRDVGIGNALATTVLIFFRKAVV